MTDDQLTINILSKLATTFILKMLKQDGSKQLVGRKVISYCQVESSYLTMKDGVYAIEKQTTTISDYVTYRLGEPILNPVPHRFLAGSAKYITGIRVEFGGLQLVFFTRKDNDFKVTVYNDDRKSLDRFVQVKPQDLINLQTCQKERKEIKITEHQHTSF